MTGFQFALFGDPVPGQPSEPGNDPVRFGAPTPD